MNKSKEKQKKTYTIINNIKKDRIWIGNSVYESYDLIWIGNAVALSRERFGNVLRRPDKNDFVGIDLAPCVNARDFGYHF